jgi:hypothetical protein
MNVIYMGLLITVVAYLALPIAALPYATFPLGTP